MDNLLPLLSEADKTTLTQLLALDSKLDAELMHRQIAIKEAQSIVENRILPLQTLKKYRIYINSTMIDSLVSTNNLYQQIDLANSSEPSVILKVQGNLLTNKGVTRSFNFSDIFDKVLIEWKSVESDELLETVVWQKFGKQETPIQGVECKRLLSKFNTSALKVSVFFYLSSTSEYLELPESLMRLVGSQIASIPSVYRELVHYIKTKHLFVDGVTFNVDEPLGKVLGLEIGTRQSLHVIISQLRELYPFASVYRIDHSLGEEESVVDIVVDCPDAVSISEQMPYSMEYMQLTKQINDFDKDIGDKLRELGSCNHKISLLKALKEDPKGFLERILANQPIMQSTERPNEFYNLPWAMQAASNMAKSVKY
jgi:hypothetical protein